MKMFLVALIAISLPVFARNECLKPGEVLSRNFLNVQGDEAQVPFTRQGTAQIPTTANFDGSFTVNTYKVYQETFCETEIETYSEEVCQSVDVDMARGNGNDLFSSFFDFNISLLKRSEMFAKNVKFMETAASAERLDISKQILTTLDQYAATSGIPRSWAAFTAMIYQSMVEGIIPASVHEDIVNVYVKNNQKVLGFVPMTGVLFEEGKGNGKLKRLFNLDVTAQVRAAMINTMIEGATKASSEKLSQSFIQFASANGIPDSWDQFVVMMKDSVIKRAITNEEYKMMVVSFEKENRTNLGYEIAAKMCKVEARSRNVNKIKNRKAKEFLAQVSKKFKLLITDAALLSNETEIFQMKFDGVNAMYLSTDSRYNSYRVTSQSEEDGVAKMIVTGTRKQITPSNTIFAQLTRKNSLLGLKLQNTAFNPLVGGKVVVKVDFYEEVVMWSDLKLITHSYALLDGNMKEYVAQVIMRTPRRTPYVTVSVQILGSKYFNEKASEVKTFR